MTENLEIFILTCNRCKFLKQSLSSVLNQTIPVKVTVVDNASDDETQGFVNKMREKYSNLNYIRQEKNVGWLGNIKTAIANTHADYVMYFHDDDILHPQYVEFIKKTLDSFDNVDLICSNMTTFTDEKSIDIKNLKEVDVNIFKKKGDFGAYVLSSLFLGNIPLYFPSVVYRTQNLKKVDMDFLFQQYGKIADKPMVISSIVDGCCVLGKNPALLNYRIHEGQDSSTSSNGPFPEQIIKHNKLLYDISGHSFLADISSASWLKYLWEWGNNKQNISFYKLALMAKRENACNVMTLLFANPISRPFMKILQKFLTRNYNKKGKLLNYEENTIILD